MADSVLEILLLGGFTTRINGKPLPKLRTRQGIRLLALLALRPNRDIERHFLAATLWPDVEESLGLAHLRRELTDLRNALGEHKDRLRTTLRTNLRLDVLSGEQSRATVDVALFEQAAKHRDQPQALDRALALYTGPFLDGFQDEWIQYERDRLAKIHQDVLEARANLALDDNDSQTALPLLRQAISLYPYQESSYRLLMEALAEAGNDTEVVTVYEKLCKRLRRDLSTEPDIMTRNVYQRLRQKTRTFPTPKTVVSSSHARESSPRVPSPVVVPASILPVFLTRFFGREVERACLREWLTTSPTPPDSPFSPDFSSLPDFRLVTLTGMGGTGKTRLAVELAYHFQKTNVFGGGVFFVSLGEVTSGRQLVDALAVAFGVATPNQRSTLELVQSALIARSPQGKDILLVLDNFEQLVEENTHDSPHSVTQSSSIIISLLNSVPRLRCLVTSRRPLRVVGEREYPLESLPVPKDSLDNVTQIASVSLFVDRVRAIRPEFVLSSGASGNMRVVAELCRRLEGSPLALEMAATWTRILSPSQILSRFVHALNLSTKEHGKPERQKSMRSTLEWSYGLLGEPLQDFFAALSVFRGNFSLEAVESLLGSFAIEGLSELAERSMVVVESGASLKLARYRLLEVVREFAAEKLVLSRKESDLKHRHAMFYTELTRQVGHGLRSMVDVVAQLSLLDADYSNVLAALENLEAAKDFPELLCLCRNLVIFWEYQVSWEGQYYIERTLACTVGQPMSVDRAHLLLGLIPLFNAQSRPDDALKLCEEVFDFYQTMDKGSRQSQEILLGALHAKSTYYYAASELESALEWSTQALAIAKDITDDRMIANILSNRGVMFNRLDRLEEAIANSVEAVEILRRKGNLYRLGVVLSNLGNAYLRNGEIFLAKSTFLESVAHLRDSRQVSWLVNALQLLARCSCHEGDYIGARTILNESFHGFKSASTVPILAFYLEDTARVSVAMGFPEYAVFFFAAAEERRKHVKFGYLPPSGEEKITAWTESVAKCGENATKDWLWSGQRASREEIIETALKMTTEDKEPASV